MGNLEVNDGIPPALASWASMDETRGDRIKRLREARGLTQPALARLLISMGAPATLTKAAVHKWESGDTKNIQLETFILLAQALGTDPPYILWGHDRSPPESRPTGASGDRASKRKA
jgi:transcriptional regulator with XRE-family HTH domain